MAVVAPFRALRYNPERIADISVVVTPPYDVISHSGQERYYAAHPNNVIRLELNKQRPEDDATDNRYTRAAEHLRKWRESGVLVRDEAPAFYVSETTYTDAEGVQRVRRGFFTLLRVEDFEKRIVLPHEKTFTGHKEDRLKLTKATGANVSPIFALYPDDDNLVQQTLNEFRQAESLNDIVDPQGLVQRLYAVTDLEACRRVARLMADKVIFIADGHHRYETAINYRNYMLEKHPEAGPDASFNFVLTYLCSMSDPGLTVFACHRVVHKLDFFDAENFLSLAKDYFEAEELPFGPSDPGAKERLTAALAEAGGKAPSLGLAAHQCDKLYLLTLRPGVMEAEAGLDVDGPLRSLDVVVLTRMVLEKILGMDNSYRDLIHIIGYDSDMGGILEDVNHGRSQLAFLLNPTKVSQVQAVAEAQLIMPRKSTYFYPKVLTGLVINQLEPVEDLAVCRLD